MKVNEEKCEDNEVKCAFDNKRRVRRLVLCKIASEVGNSGELSG